MTKDTKADQNSTVDWTAAYQPTRRRVAQALCGCAVVAMTSHRSHAADEESEDAKPSLQSGDRFAVEPDSGEPQPIKAADLKPGQAVMGGYPIDPATGKLRTDTRMNMVNLVRLADAKAGEATAGVLVFSAICTHKACAITSWQAESNRWRCFCHMSEFDAANQGERVEGPATDPLPAVPISIDAEGYIVASGGFSTAPGATG